MDVDFTPEDMSFREEVRSFIEENYPKHLGSLDRGDMSKEDLLAWHKVLHTKGWVAPSWPAEFGGTDWTVTQRYIFNEESARHGTIPPMPFGVQILSAPGNDRLVAEVAKALEIVLADNTATKRPVPDLSKLQS